MSPRLRALLSWWNLGAVLCAAAVLALFQRCVPLNMDEFVSYQTLACVTHPHAAENVFCSSCASFYLRVLGGFNLPLLTYDYIGSLSSWLYAPLFVLWPSPASARLLGLIALAVQAVILARLFRFRPGAVFCCLLLFFPYSFVHIADTGPVAFQATSVLLVCYLLRRWLLSRRPTRRLGLLAIAGLVIALGCWVKPTYLFVSAGLVTTALLAFGLAWFRRPAERGRRALEYLVLLLCAAVPATLIYHARHPGGGPYLPVFGTSFVPDQIALAGLGARLRDNVLHFVLQPLDVTSMHFDGPVATPVRSVALGLLTLAVIAGAFFTRPAPRRPRAEIAGNLALFGVALLLVATNVYAKSMHHAVLAYPFLLLAAGRSLQLQRHRRWAIAAFSLFVVLQASLFLQLPTLAEEARRHGNPKAFAAELHAELDRRDAADSVIVCVDWGIYFIQSLYGPRSQVVLFLCSPDDDQLEAAAAIAVRLKRDLTLVGLAGNNPIRDRLRPVRSVVERAGPGVGSPWRIWRLPRAELGAWSTSLRSPITPPSSAVSS